jgi:hypothetical protein
MDYSGNILDDQVLHGLLKFTYYRMRINRTRPYFTVSQGAVTRALSGNLLNETISECRLSYDYTRAVGSMSMYLHIVTQNRA